MPWQIPILELSISDITSSTAEVSGKFCYSKITPSNNRTGKLANVYLVLPEGLCTTSGTLLSSPQFDSGNQNNYNDHLCR